MGTRYPKIPDYSENISGRVRVLLKIIGSGRVSGTRLTLTDGQEYVSMVNIFDEEYFDFFS